MSETLRILIVDDHAVVREGLRALIASEPGMVVVGEAADGVEAVLKARSLTPDVVLLDLLMPRKSGIEGIGDVLIALSDFHTGDLFPDDLVEQRSLAQCTGNGNNLVFIQVSDLVDQ